MLLHIQIQINISCSNSYFFCALCVVYIVLVHTVCTWKTVCASLEMPQRVNKRIREKCTMIFVVSQKKHHRHMYSERWHWKYFEHTLSHGSSSSKILLAQFYSCTFSLRCVWRWCSLFYSLFVFLWCSELFISRKHTHLVFLPFFGKVELAFEYSQRCMHYSHS